MSASYEAGRKWRAAPRRQRCSAPVVISSAIFLLHLAASEANASLDYYHSHQTNGFNNIFGKNELPPPGSGEQVEIGGSGGTIGDELSNGCPSGLLTFELSTGFIYKPTSAETLAMMPSTLQLTDCLDYCLHNATCLAINFEMGLCVLLSSSAKQNPANLYSSQFPVFTIYAEKKCLLSADPQVAKQRRRCQRAWTFERVAGYEMKTPPRRRLKLASKEHCMEACLSERDFECRSANWYRSSGECTLSEQDRHSVSQSEAGDQHIKASLLELYGPSNLTAPTHHTRPPTLPAGLYQNYYEARSNGRNLSGGSLDPSTTDAGRAARSLASRFRELRQLAAERLLSMAATATPISVTPPAIPRGADWASAGQYVLDMPANALVDYLENNCVYEPNKLCEFRKIQNRVLKTVDSIYQDVNSLDECKQKCLNAPYRCYSFDYGETVDRVCRTSHLDQASLLSVKEPYLDVAGAITYELASCFNVSIQCRAKEMVAQVSSSKTFRGKIYVKSRPSSCVNDVKEALRFELSMRYHDEACDVRASSNSQQGVFSNEIIIQHHDRIVTTQDVGLSVYCQYDLGNKSITNNVDLAIERIEDGPLESKNQASVGGGATGVPGGSGSINSPLTITSLATTVVRSPNVTMRITNMGGQPVASATVGDRLALLFEIKEKTSPFGIFVREIIAMDGRQVLATAAASSSAGKLSAGSRGYHYANGSSGSEPTGGGGALAESLANVPATPANSIQFIDAHGCPTDANIMGPLVKMDPSGHRVLAPFDAFKFPTSDVVFFRAVVSSCVAECQPVQCAGPDGQPLETGGYPSSLAGGSTISPALLHSSTLASGFPTTLTDLTLLQQQIGSSSRRPLIAETRTSTAAPEAPPTTRWTAAFGQDISSAASAIATTLASPLSSTSGSQNRTKPVSSSGDSLTTVPGFASSGPSPDMWTLEEAGGLVSTDSGQQQRHQQVNMTNNHQLGKAPPRPTVVPSPGQLQQQQPLLQLDKLTNLEKHQLVQLFESNLKQQSTVGGGAGNTDRMTGNGVGNNSSLAEMADFYSGFLTSVMLNNLNNNNNIENGALSSVADYKRTEKVAQQLAATGAGDDFLSPMALLEAAQRKTQPAGTASSNSASLLELQTLLGPYLLANRTDDIKAIVRALLERRTKVDSAAGHQPEVQSQAMPKQKQPADNLNDIVPVQQQQQQQQQPKSRSQQQQQHISGNNRTQHLQQRRSAAQEVVANKRKRDKASQLQAFADSYLGAHQTFGGRRRRRRRQVEEQVAAEDDEDNLTETDDNFVAISEVPAATVAPPGASEGHFTRATVHMYRRRNQHLSEQRHRRYRRRKREALPRYEVDELVVQSIKIVDRLQFPEDGGVGTTNVRPAAAATAGQKRRSPARKEPARQQQQPQQQHHPHQSAPLAGGDSGEPSESGEAREARALLTWSSSSVLSLILIALTFLFAQVFLVALCLLDWRRRRRPRPLAAARPILAPDSRSGSLDTLSSCGSSSAYSTATEARRSLPQYLLGEPRTSGRPPPPGTGRRAARFPRPLAPNGAGRAEMRRQQLRNGSSNSRYPAEIDGNHSPVAYNCQTLLHAHNHEPPQPPPPPPPVDLKQTD